MRHESLPHFPSENLLRRGIRKRKVGPLLGYSTQAAVYEKLGDPKSARRVVFLAPLCKALPTNETRTRCKDGGSPIGTHQDRRYDTQALLSLKREVVYFIADRGGDFGGKISEVAGRRRYVAPRCSGPRFRANPHQRCNTCRIFCIRETIRNSGDKCVRGLRPHNDQNRHSGRSNDPVRAGAC